MRISSKRVDWEYKSPFRISYSVRTHAETIVVEVHEGGKVGRGEALGVPYCGESTETMLAQLVTLGSELAAPLDRKNLAAVLGPGGARNALDCALWDLEAKTRGRRAWELAGIESVRPLSTTYTLGLDTPRATAGAADALRAYSKLKLKLSGEDDLERVTAVREVRPDVDLYVDANQAWTEQQLESLAPRFASLGVRLIEQPLPAGQDDFLRNYRSPVPLCADESCQSLETLATLVGKYEFANIKLDKSGGLTEALRLARGARELGLQLMVGCMGGSSLSMAPAFIVGQLCQVVDLDGPLLLKSDVPDAVQYVGDQMFSPSAELWG